MNEEYQWGSIDDIPDESKKAIEELSRRVFKKSAVSIGELEVLHTWDLLIPMDETCVVDFFVDGWMPKLIISFNDDPNTHQDFELSPTAAGILLKFTNWNNPLGTAITKPFQFAVKDTGEALSLLFSSQRVNTVNKCTLQIMRSLVK